MRPTTITASALKQTDVENTQAATTSASFKSPFVAIPKTELMPVSDDHCMALSDTLPAGQTKAQLETAGAVKCVNDEVGVVADSVGGVKDKGLEISAGTSNLPTTAAVADMSQPAYDEDLLREPLSARWSPLGADYDDEGSASLEPFAPESEIYLLSNSDGVLLDKQQLVNENAYELARLRNIEEEQELLTSSLMALTSHFAHVQLRVRQIVEAPAQERDQLLKDLEDFAFQGIPDSCQRTETTSALPCSEGEPHIPDTAARNEAQCALIDQMKCQLNELEQLAYESGAPVLPQHMVLAKQKIIIDELKSKLNLQVKESQLPELSAEELKNQVDSAFGEFVGPLKMNEQLVAQLKTQITDLERFIAFLQCDSDESKLKMLDGVGSDTLYEAYNSYAAKKKKKEQLRLQLQQQQNEGKSNPKAADTTEASTSIYNAELNVEQKEMMSSTSTAGAAAAAAIKNDNGVRDSLNNKAHGLLDKASLLMQMFANTHIMNAKSEHFQKNSLKKTSKGNHWGDLRAQLEVDIQEVTSLAATLSCDREKLLALRRKCQMSEARRKISNTTTSTPTVTLPFQEQQVLAPYNVDDSDAFAVVAILNSSDSDEDAFGSYNWHTPTSMCSAKEQRVVRMRGDSIVTISRELTQVVRKNFAKTLQKLIQHGLRMETNSSTSSLIVPFMRCLNPLSRSPPTSPSATSSSAAAAYAGNAPVRQRTVATKSFATHMPSLYDGEACANYDDVGQSSIFGYGRPMHAWELILEYYYLKNGEEYNNTPGRKLSQSFNLDIVDAHAVTAKQRLLSAIGMIVAMHRPYKRSLNAHFKAFVCAGLNAHLLVEWLNLILNCNELIEVYYSPNSYVARTGFRDSLRSIDVLTKYEFELPVDLAIRHFRNL